MKLRADARHKWTWDEVRQVRRCLLCGAHLYNGAKGWTISLGQHDLPAKPTMPPCNGEKGQTIPERPKP